MLKPFCARGMFRGWVSRFVAAGVGLVAALALPGAAAAAVYNYVDWMTADVAKGTASGTITLPDNSTVTVTFAAINADGSAGTLFGAQVDPGATNYWQPDAPYISPEVENAPPGTDILQLLGGLNQTYKVTLSEPIKDPIMAIVSLGSPSITITYNFDSPFTIVSQGVGYWGGGDMALKQLPDNVLQGTEGHGTIRFIGTFASFSWTVPNPEGWHGFTFGIRTTERIEPTEAGVPDGAVDAGEPEESPEVAAEVAPEVAAEPVPEPSAGDDAGTDAGKGKTAKGGCDCSVPPTGPSSLVGLAAAAALLAFARRRRR